MGVPGDARDDAGNTRGRLQCPFCASYDVERLFIASLRVDSCACVACQGRWDEDREAGAPVEANPDRRSILGPRRA